MAAARSRLVAELTRIAGSTSALVGLSVVPLLGSRDLEHAAIEINPDGRRRFPMASTAKVPLALTVLRLVDSGALALDQRLQLVWTTCGLGLGSWRSSLLAAARQARRWPTRSRSCWSSR